MKKIYSVFMLLLFTASLYAQITISFEEMEGFELGNVHGQNEWEVTEAADGVLSNQIISDAQASDGVYSFKNANEPEYDAQWLPIFGIAKTFDTPLDYNAFTVSYDVLVTDTMGADFEFVAYTIIDGAFTPVAGLGMENRGQIYIIKDEDYGFHTIDAEWEPNTWVTIKIEVNQDEIKYYVEDVLQYTLINFSQSDIHGINMLHNNYGNDAYYDNIQINTESLSVEEQDLASTIKLYPNPTSDFVNFRLKQGQNIKEVAVYNITGKKISVQNSSSVDLRSFPAGTYVLKASLVDGQELIRKVIKK